MHENNIAVNEEADLMLKKLEQEGKTAVLVSIDGRLSGMIAMADTVKQGAKEAIDSLRRMGAEVITLKSTTFLNERQSPPAADSFLGFHR